MKILGAVRHSIVLAKPLCCNGFLPICWASLTIMGGSDDTATLVFFVALHIQTWLRFYVKSSAMSFAFNPRYTFALVFFACIHVVRKQYNMVFLRKNSAQFFYFLQTQQSAICLPAPNNSILKCSGELSFCTKTPQIW